MGTIKEKNQTNVKQGIITYYFLCKRNSSRISLSQVSVSFILRENSLRKGKTLDNKGFMKL